MLTPEVFAALTRRPDRAGGAELRAAPQRELVAKPGPAGADAGGFGDTVSASHMLGFAALSDPQNRKARAALGNLAAAERVAQLCDLEAIEQVRDWKPEFHAELLIDYATADPVLAGNTLVAEGAAIQGNGRWHRLRFRCVLDAHGSVGGFEFALGSVIPEREWEAHGLPPPGEGDDEK